MNEQASPPEEKDPLRLARVLLRASKNPIRLCRPNSKVRPSSQFPFKSSNSPHTPLATNPSSPIPDTSILNNDYNTY